MNSTTIKLIAQSILLLAIQVLLFRNVALFDVAFCFVYISIILLLPIEADRIGVLLIAFIVGLTVDVFYNSFGIHASTAVLIGFIRFHWTNIITPQGGYDANSSPNVNNMGLLWFVTYILPLIFVHHFALFFIESGGFTYFWFTLLKVFLSTFFTFLVILLIQFLFASRKRGL